jgi:hypothetical protein
MAQDATPTQFDIDCLRHVAADAEARRVSLAAAMIKLHALSIARSTPALRDEALEIVRYAAQLYAGLPDRAALAQIVEEHMSRPVTPRGRSAAAEALAEAVWNHFRCGRR